MTRPRARRGIPDLGRHTRPGPREQRALLLLVWAGFLTTEQVREAAGYTTLRRAQRRLRVWLDHGYTRVELQSGALHLPSIHIPTAKAREFLAESGLIEADYAVARFPRPQKRAHALLIRSVFTVLAAADSQGGLRLSDFRFDHELGRVEPFRAAGVIPDAVLTAQTRDGNTVTCAVECDTGSETTTTLRAKFSRWRAILDVWSPPGLILLAVAEREGRRRTLVRVMAEVGIGAVGVALSIDGLRTLVTELSASGSPAVRVGRAERQGGQAEVGENERVVANPNGAFRVLVERRTRGGRVGPR